MNYQTLYIELSRYPGATDAEIAAALETVARWQ